MICERCGALVAKPEMSFGSSWLYLCGCGKRTIRPAQQFRGSVTIHGFTQPCLAAAGLIDNDEGDR